MQKPNEFTLAQAANYGDVSLRTVQRWVKDGRIVARYEKDNLTGRTVCYLNAADFAEFAGLMFRRSKSTKYHYIL